MPNPNGINQVQAPIDIAKLMFKEQVDVSIIQLLGSQRRTRVQYIGDLPAEPIIETVAQMVPEQMAPEE